MPKPIDAAAIRLATKICDKVRSEMLAELAITGADINRMEKEFNNLVNPFE